MTRWSVLVVFTVQALCTVFFISDILMTVLGLRANPIAWQTRELLELGAALGLFLGMVLGWIAWRRTHLRARNFERRLRAASGAFIDLMEDRFTTWGLTPAERDVAFFALKGLSLDEIAAVRETSVGTVKAQTNAIYRKAGVSGRAQLLSLFIDDLLNDALPAAQPMIAGIS